MVCILPRDVLFFDSVESRLLPNEVVLGRWGLGVRVFFPFPSFSFFLFSVNIPDISSSTYGRESLWAKLSWDRDFCLLAAWLNTGHFSVSWFIWRKKGWKLFHTLLAYPSLYRNNDQTLPPSIYLSQPPFLPSLPAHITPPYLGCHCSLLPCILEGRGQDGPV